MPTCVRPGSDPTASAQRTPYQRFERDGPNQLWQMDFKGHFEMANGRRCHPLTAVDDHSRYAITVAACENEKRQTVQSHLTRAFQRYGLPERILCDNGQPWGVPFLGPRALRLTKLGVWLLRLGVGVTHGRPFHPQTQGKDERFHRTLNDEVIRRRVVADCRDAESHFSRFVHSYNHERPHEALGLETPAKRYRPSPRSMPAMLPPIEYAEREVRTVCTGGKIHFRGHKIRVTRALAGYPIALRPTTADGLMQVIFADQVIGELDMREAHWLIRGPSARSAPSSPADQPTTV